MSRWQPNYHVACGIQKKILAQMEAAELTPKDLAALTSAWEKLEERKRILRMKPLPKAVDVAVKSKGPVHRTFEE
jgi:hypothetical protein